MKYLASLLAITVSVLVSVSASAQFSNLFPIFSPAAPVHSVTLLNIETPFRCRTDSLDKQRVTDTIRLNRNDFQMKRVNLLDELPRYEVNGFSFEDKPLEEALQELLEEAKINVFTEDETYVTLNAKDVYGELSVVVDELAKAGDTYYKYDNAEKKLFLSRRAQFELKLPVNRSLMLGMLDAIRGANIDNVNPNWATGVLTLLLTREEESRVRDLLKRITNDGKLLVAETKIYALNSGVAGGSWGEIVRQFGADKVHTSNNGLMGKLLSMAHPKESTSLMNAIRSYYQVSLISQGMAVVPNGWKMRFDIGRCAEPPYTQNKLSLLLYPRLRTDGSLDMQVTIDSASGELSTFKVNTSVDEELAIIGMPDNDHYGSELLAVMNLKLIRLVGGK